jgi:hypothetical protein
VRRLISIGALMAGLVLVPCALADVSDDVAITSNTPSVSHARVGDTITFTVTETNLGTTGRELDMEGTRFSSNLQWAGIDCGLVSADGPWCEYGFDPMPFAVTARYMFSVLPGVRVATFTPCVADSVDANATNDCMTGSVRVIGRD